MPGDLEVAYLGVPVADPSALGEFLTNVAFVGLEAHSPEAFDRAVCRAWASGAPVTEGSPSEAAARRVAALVRVDTPWGVPFEIVHGVARGSDPVDSPLAPGLFVAEDQAFGHVVFMVADLDAADRFAREVFGFTHRDWWETDLGGNPLTVRFCDRNSHHHSHHHSLTIGGRRPVQSLLRAS